MVLIRADANEHIGTGHVMRCLSIARAFADAGHEIRFVTADHRGDVLIKCKGFKTICMDSKWNDMETELPALFSVIASTHPALVLTDSYYVTETYFRKLSGMVRTCYIDDMNVTFLDVDYLINYNIFSLVYDYSQYKKTRTKVLLGPQYAPIRNEFKDMPKHVINNVKDVLISAGGADPERITEMIMKGICPMHLDILFHFIVGALNPRINEIKELAGKNPNVVLHINEKHMSDLMKKCDLAVSAAGITLYELCAAGIPTITYTLADNQLDAAAQFQAQGIMLSAGDGRNNDEFIRRLDNLFTRMAFDETLRAELSELMQTLVDGNGTKRIVDALA